MCGRYWIDAQANMELEEIISQMQRIGDVKTRGEIFPGDRVPVICKSRAGNTRPFAMEWGFRLPDGKRIINARSETAREKPMFRQSMENRRCLLPMSAYFEWETRENGKIKYRIAPAEDGLFYLAGLYRFEDERPVCTVLTTSAADEIAFIHHRMPVILGSVQRDSWLAGEDMDFSQRMALTFAEA